MRIRQFELRDGDESWLVCWLEDDSRLKEGARLTLKAVPDREWTVRRRYGATKELDELNRSWKVGGLL